MSNHRSSYGRLTRVAALFALIFTGSISASVAGSEVSATSLAAATMPSASESGNYTYQKLDYPGSSLTIFWGINDFGEVGGQYTLAGDPSATSHAMVYRHGRFEQLDPNSVLGKYFSAAGGPNDLGTTYGAYADATGLQHGFSIQGGHFETIDFPGHLNSNVDVINVFGAIVGVYWDADGVFHGMLRHGHGIDTPINVAGALDTYPLGMNDKDEVVGYWDINPSSPHGFYRSTSGQISTIDVPGASSTATFQINDSGQMVGYYADASGYHGYVETQKQFRTVDVPGAVGTFATSINNLGVIAGEYLDATGNRHGFVATPVAPTQHN